MKALNVRPISELKNHTKELVAEVADGGAPIVVTQNGKPRVVVVSAAEYDRQQDTLALLKLLAQSQHSVRTSALVSTAEVRRRAKLVLAKARQR